MAKCFFEMGECNVIQDTLQKSEKNPKNNLLQLKNKSSTYL